MSADPEPRATRPHMPGYEEMFHEHLLPWHWALEHLENSRNYWFATTKPGGSPHVMPLWGVWLDNRFCFSTGASSRKARNLALNPECVVTTENGNEAIIVEGAAVPLAPERRELFLKTYSQKYNWPMDGSYEPFFELIPRVAFGLIEGATPEGYGATRWLFD
jgi:nitroimidazol reductase NimA-like FMN-containing flavoprotein (pyridoxamine 5'-phosphate oxidase superfamily)